ncbi:MAG: transglycosylase SLT domain-containing protein [Nitrospirae bacterium]|nr:transglycosylase SLT domain-containing protein [Nitrospirota bacterium]
MNFQRRLFFIIFILAIYIISSYSVSFSEEQISVEVVAESVETTEQVQADIVDPLNLVSYGLNALELEVVQRELTHFSETIKQRFHLYLQRSGRYIGLMREILKGKDMPEELAFLPLVESGFNLRAKSRMKAVGPWQFIESTARLYGLKINWWVDERRDPVKSTEAAADYLSDLYERFGSWSLAMAAYNAGEGKIQRALRRTNADDYWMLLPTKYIKPETKHYVPKFIAAKTIAENPEEYGFEDVSYEEPFIYEEVTVRGALELLDVARCTNTSLDELDELNPELVRDCTPPDAKEYTLRIPVGTKEAFLKDCMDVQKSKRCLVAIYKIKRGDTLSGISKKTGVSINTILYLNRGIKKSSRLRIGRIIYMPSGR